jgi:hypothetical protein
MALSRVTTCEGTIPISASRSVKLRKEPPNQPNDLVRNYSIMEEA